MGAASGEAQRHLSAEPGAPNQGRGPQESGAPAEKGGGIPG